MSLNIFIPLQVHLNSIIDENLNLNLSHTIISSLSQTIINLNEVLTSLSIPHTFTIIYSNYSCNVVNPISLKERVDLIQKKIEQKIYLLEIKDEDFNFGPQPLSLSLFIQKLFKDNKRNNYCVFYPYTGTHHTSTLVEIYNTIKTRNETICGIFTSRFEKDAKLINFSDCELTSLKLKKYSNMLMKLAARILKFKALRIHDLDNDLAIYNTSNLLNLYQNSNKQIHSKNLLSLINFELPLIYSDAYKDKVINYPDKNINSWIKQKIALLVDTCCSLPKIKIILKHL
ncbi:MAG: hypothetical protein HQK51_00200 [Oligoflexia bacterium]|nr:hypothetical protein [Oligoflexia bacterium]